MARVARTARTYAYGRPALAMAALVLMAPAWAAAPWPRVPLPRQVEAFEVGKEMVVNGMPVRVQGFVSRAAPAELAASMRQLLGAPLMEDRHGTTLVLGRANGAYYITVQLSPLGSGTRALVAVTKPPIGERPLEDSQSIRRLMSAMPPGSTLASHTSSADEPTRADLSAVVNSHSIDINVEYVKRMLRADGFTLEREASPSQLASARTGLSRGARTMFFKRPGSEAIAVVTKNESGDSVIVLNRVNSAEPNK